MTVRRGLPGNGERMPCFLVANLKAQGKLQAPGTCEDNMGVTYCNLPPLRAHFLTTVARNKLCPPRAPGGVSGGLEMEKIQALPCRD